MFLVLAPWMPSWSHNYFAQVFPAIEPWMINTSVRGAVSGVGLVTAVAGVREIVGAFSSQSPDTAAPGGKPPSQ